MSQFRSRKVTERSKTTRCFYRDVSHHESWYNWLLELGFESVHQLLSFGVVERQYTWRE